MCKTRERESLQAFVARREQARGCARMLTQACKILLLLLLGVNMVDGTLGHLTATEARAFNDVVGEFGASDGGI